MAVLDTLAIAQDLETAGMARDHARAVAQAVAAAGEAGRDDLATRADLQAVKADLQADMAALEARLTWRLVIAAGVIVAAVKLIPVP